LRIHELGEKYTGHSFISSEKEHFMTLDQIDGITYYMICPVCSSNDLRHENWFSHKEYDAPLCILCERCGEITPLEDMEVENER